MISYYFTLKKMIFFNDWLLKVNSGLLLPSYKTIVTFKVQNIHYKTNDILQYHFIFTILCIFRFKSCTQNEAKRSAVNKFNV